MEWIAEVIVPVATGIGGVTLTALFDRRKQLFPGARIKPLEDQFISYFEAKSKEIKDNLVAGRKIEVHNFDKGWNTLFDNFFAPDAPGERVLRDFSTTGHVGLSFGGYDFKSYPEFVERKLKSLEDNVGTQHGYKIRFLILCSKETPDFLQAEKFFGEILSLKAGGAGSSNWEEKFTKWREGKGNPEVELRLTNTYIAERIHTKRNTVNAECPFNVYGRRSASVSVVKQVSFVRPIPHLDVYLNPDDVEKYRNFFDALWQESVELEKEIFKTSVQEIMNLGSGELFRRWAFLEL